MIKQNQLIYFLFLPIFLVIFISPNIVSAIEYQKVILGDTIRIGEFVFEDDYTPSTADCTVTIYDPNNTLKVNAGAMTENASGWHYYDYAVGSGESTGSWSTSMSCGSTLGGDLIVVDKTFVVLPITTTESNLAAIKAKTDTIDWADVTATKGNVANLILEVGTGNITSIKTKTDTIAWGDITGIITTSGDIKLKTDTIAWADVTAIKTKIDTIDWTDVTGIKTKTDTIAWGDITAIKAKTDTIGWADIATLISEVGTGRIAGIKTKTDTIAWGDITGLISSNGDIKAKTDTIVWGDITGIKTKTDTIDWTNVTGIKTKTDTIIWGDVSTIKTNVATLITEVGTGQISGIKTKTDTIAWADVTGIVTSNGLIKAKTDTIAWADVTAIKTKTDTIAWGDITGIKTKTDTIAWGDIGSLGTMASAIKAKTDTINWSDIANIPLNVWNYSTRSLTSFGALISEIWNYSTRSLTTSAPPQVIITNMGNLTVPNITANVLITNEGFTGFEYQYEWCVVSSIDNLCGGGDDIDYGSAAKFINSGQDFNTTLSAVVPAPGTYYFKVAVHYGIEKSGASRSFVATSSIIGGGGGGGGGANTETLIPIINGVCSGADFNHDKKVNSIDFSILLSFWKTNSPFLNSCVDINKDSKVNSIDFSILLSQWGTAGLL